MADPTTPTTFWSGMAATVKILEVTYSLRAVTDQTVALLNTTQHVERNIREAKRLFALHSHLLTPQEHSWVTRSIADTEGAVGEVAKLIEPARVNIQADRGVSIKNRAVWVFRDNLKAGEKMTLLNVTHQTLGTVISALHAKAVVAQDKSVEENLEQGARNAAGDVPLPSYEWSEFLAWQRRRSSKPKRPTTGGVGFETQIRRKPTAQRKKSLDIQTPKGVPDLDHGTQTTPPKEGLETSQTSLAVDPPFAMNPSISVAELPCPLSPLPSELEASEVRGLSEDRPMGGPGSPGFIRKSASSTFSVPEMPSDTTAKFSLPPELPRGLPPSTMKRKSARSLSNSWLAYQASRSSFELSGSGV